jgi:putative transposase
MLLRSLLTGLQSQAVMQAEIIALRHQVIVLQRTQKKNRLVLGWADRCLWVWLSRLWSRWRSALIIVKPETIVGWHRQGFQWYWTRKIRHGRSGRPRVSRETRDLIRIISRKNSLWGAPRIHGELLKLGITISEASVAKYMVRHPKPPSQTWRTFLANHVSQLVSVDFFTVHTIWFESLFVFVLLAHHRRRVVHFNVTAHPTAEWTAANRRRYLRRPFIIIRRAVDCPGETPRRSGAILLPHIPDDVLVLSFSTGKSKIARS